MVADCVCRAGRTKRVECVNRTYENIISLFHLNDDVSTFEVQPQSSISLVVIEREEDAILRLTLFLLLSFLSFRTVSKR